MLKTDDTILVVGGGIGGIAAALAAAEAGQKTTVLEQAPQFGEVGAGIQMAPNAMEILTRLGVADRIAEFAVFPKRLVLKDVYTAEELTTLDLGDEFKERYGYPYCVLHRSDLHRALLEKAQDNPLVNLVTDSRVVSANETEAGCFVKTEAGNEYKGKAVVGADGLWSNVRKKFSDDQPICSKYVAYRGTIPISEISEDAAMDDVIMWIGPNLHVVQYPVRRGELYNQVVVFKSFMYEEGSDKDWGTPEEMDKVFEGCHPLVTNALSFIQRQFKWPMYDRNPISNWTDGNITLLGDAAHPMLQYLAQGGAQALEDAGVLADKLKEHGENYEQAFKEYQEIRIPRSAKVQTSARMWGEIIHAEDPVSIVLRNDIMLKRDGKDFSYSDWLYGHKRNLTKDTVKA